MNDQNTPPSEPKLTWVTPHLEHLGDMDDVKGNNAQPPTDGSFSPDRAAS